MTNSQHSLEQPRKGWLASALTSLRTREGDRKGFTLIELLVVIGIIAILAAIAIPIFMNQEKTAHRSALESDVKSSVAQVMDATGNRPDFTGAPVVETAASGNTVVAANHPTDGASFMIYGYSEAAGGVEICFDSSTSALGEHACAQPNLARVAAESGNPGGTNPGDEDGEEHESGGAGSEDNSMNPICFWEGAPGSSAYAGGYSWVVAGYEPDIEAFKNRQPTWLDAYYPGCESEWLRGAQDADAGNPENPGPMDGHIGGEPARPASCVGPSPYGGGDEAAIWIGRYAASGGFDDDGNRPYWDLATFEAHADIDFEADFGPGCGAEFEEGFYGQTLQNLGTDAYHAGRAASHNINVTYGMGLTSADDFEALISRGGHTLNGHFGPGGQAEFHRGFEDMLAGVYNPDGN